MESRKTKYNCLFVFTLVLVICTVVFSCIMVPNVVSDADTNTNTSVSDDIASELNNGTSLDLSELPLKSYLSDGSFKKAFNYAFNYLINSSAYTSKSTGTIVADFLNCNESIYTYKQINRVKNQSYVYAQFVKKSKIGFNLGCQFFQHEDLLSYQTTKNYADNKFSFVDVGVQDTTLSDFISSGNLDPIYFIYGIYSTDIKFQSYSLTSVKGGGYTLNFTIASGKVFDGIWKTIQTICSSSYAVLGQISPECSTITYKVTLNEYGLITNITGSTTVKVDPGQISSVLGVIGNLEIAINMSEDFTYTSDSLVVKTL